MNDRITEEYRKFQRKPFTSKLSLKLDRNLAMNFINLGVAENYESLILVGILNFAAAFLDCTGIEGATEDLSGFTYTEVNVSGGTAGKGPDKTRREFLDSFQAGAVNFKRWATELILCNQRKALVASHYTSYFKAYDVDEIDGSVLEKYLPRVAAQTPVLHTNEGLMHLISLEAPAFVLNHSKYTSSASLCKKVVTALGDHAIRFFDMDDMKSIDEALKNPFMPASEHMVTKRALAYSYAYFVGIDQTIPRWTSARMAYESWGQLEMMSAEGAFRALKAVITKPQGVEEALVVEEVFMRFPVGMVNIVTPREAADARKNYDESMRITRVGAKVSKVIDEATTAEAESLSKVLKTIYDRYNEAISKGDTDEAARLNNAIQEVNARLRNFQ